jgi:hypothetical protein
MRLLFLAGYFGSWLIIAALLLFAPTALLWESSNASSLTGIDDDITLLALPIGGVFGVWAAVRSRPATVIHRIFCLLGVFFTALGLFMVSWFMQHSGQAVGSGPFAGLGELVAAAMSIALTALGACMFGIWAFAKLARVADVEVPHPGHQSR